MFCQWKRSSVHLAELTMKASVFNQFIECWMASKTEPLWREFASKFEPPQSQILFNFWARTSKNQSSSNGTMEEQRRNRAPFVQFGTFTEQTHPWSSWQRLQSVCLTLRWVRQFWWAPVWTPSLSRGYAKTVVLSCFQRWDRACGGSVQLTLNEW